MPKRKASEISKAGDDSKAKKVSKPGQFKEYPASKAYRLLEPGPVILITTAHKENINIMTLGFQMVMQHDPPLISFILGPWDHSFKALRATKECVVAIPTAELAEKVVDIGNCSGDEVDKFEKFGLTALDGERVKAPLVGECVANLECRVADIAMVKKYNMWILRVVKGWVNDKEIKDAKMLHHRGDGTFVVDGERLDLREKMTLWKEFQDSD